MTCETFDALNRMSAETNLHIAYTFNYYDDGRVQSRTQSNRARTQNYYPNGWLQNLTDNMNGSAQLTQSYTPDVVGNITTISRLIGAQTEQTGYGYDGLNRSGNQ